MAKLNVQIINNRLGNEQECWVCLLPNDFTFQGEDHHIVPQHLGGTNGPVVLLCNICHKKAHDAADALYKGKQKLPYREQDQREKCLYLATVIAKAKAAVESQGGFNKKFVYTDVFTFEEHELLVDLAKYYGKSQRELIRYALTMLGKQTF